MNKKGLMIKFLVTMVLALIIFAPACAVSSKLFRLSNQAKENFVDFVYEVRDLHTNGEVGEQRTSILILDGGSFIAIFKEGSSYIGLRSDSLSFSRPPDMCSDPKKACACLCREFSVSEDSNVISCAKINCEDIEEGIFTNSWSLERNDDEDIDAYHYRRATIQLKRSPDESVFIFHSTDPDLSGSSSYTGIN